MRQLTLISIAVTFFTFIREIDSSYIIILHQFTDFVFIILCWYVVSILQFAGESTSIQNPFSILLGIGILSFVSNIFTIGEQGLALGVLSMVISIYVTITSFKIKNKRFSTPFRIYGVMLLALIPVKLSIVSLIVSERHAGQPFYLEYFTLIGVLPFCAILNIIKKTGKALQEDIQTATI